MSLTKQYVSQGLKVKVRTRRYDSKEHRMRSKDLPLADRNPPPASKWSEDGMTITIYPFKAWDGSVAEDKSIIYIGVALLNCEMVDPTVDPTMASASHQAPS